MSEPDISEEAVERLVQSLRWRDGQARDAAATLRALRARLTEVEGKKEEYWQLACSNQDFGLTQQFRATAAETERDRLRGLLEEIVKQDLATADMLREFVRINLGAQPCSD